MKENFHRNSKKTGGRRELAAVLIAFCVLFFAHDALRAIGGFIGDMVYRTEYYMRTSSATVPVFLRSRIELLSEINALKDEVSAGKSSVATIAYLTRENDELRNLLSGTTSPRVAAAVIARPPYTPYDTLVIDRGSVDGIVQFAPVYYGGNMALGYVESVTAHTAHVVLFSSPGVKSTVYIFGSNIFTNAYGEGGGVIRVSVPQGIPLSVGEPVVLPSLNTGLIGIIDEVQSIPTEPEQHAYVTLSAPLQSIRAVGVATRPQELVSFEVAQMLVREASTTLFTIDVPEVFDTTLDAGEVGTTTP